MNQIQKVVVTLQTKIGVEFRAEDGAEKRAKDGIKDGPKDGAKERAKDSVVKLIWLYLLSPYSTGKWVSVGYPT